MLTRPAAGLCLSARRMVDKQQRQVSKSGRRSRESDREASLIADAGLTLALHAGNASLAAEFGLAASSCRIDLKILRERGLPSPALSIRWEHVLKQNFFMLDQRFPREKDSKRCNLVCICMYMFVYVDITYTHLYSSAYILTYYHVGIL